MNEMSLEKKFDPKEYQGDRIKINVSGCINVRRFYHWNKLLKKYVEPPRGAKYEAARSKSNGVGRVTKTFHHLHEAREWQIGRNFNPFADSKSEKKPEGYLIENLINDWQRLAWPNHRESTRDFYSKRLRYFTPLFGIRVEDLKPQVIDEWITLLKSEAYLKTYQTSRTSLDKELTMFKTMISWYMEHNDDSKLISPFKKRHSKMVIIKEKSGNEIKYMNADELTLWLSCLKDYSVMFWALAVTQQKQILRISETAAMKWPNLNLLSRTYRVTEHCMWLRSSGAEPKIIPGTKTTKAGESYYIHLRQETIEALKVMDAYRKGDLIFHDNGSILSYRQIQHAFNWAFKKAGLPHSATHVLRHSGATEFLNETGDTLALQQMGNWADQKMALHYGKILSSRARDMIDIAERRKNLRLIKSENSGEAV